MTVNAILAMDMNGGIGKNNSLPWPHSHQDMNWFKRNTIGGVVVMGRKTWESLGSKKLPNRKNIVITNSQVSGDPDEIYFGEMEKVLQVIQNDNPEKTIWVIGGADIYRQALPFCGKLYLTKFKQEYECDSYIDRSLLSPFQKFVTGQGLSNEDLSFTVWSRI